MELRIITKAEAERRDMQVGIHNTLYELDGICMDGGYYILYVPEEITDKQKKEARSYIRNMQDVVNLKVITVKFTL